MGKVLFVACTNVGQSMIEAICLDDNIKSEVVGIVNLNINNSLKKANYKTYLDTSERFGIPLHFCDNVNDEVTLKWIKSKQPDLIIQTGWSQKFKQDLLNLPQYGCIGEHPAPLPIGRGAACVNWAILTGEKLWGDTFFHMVDKYDAGEIYAQKNFNIESYDDVKTVYDKVADCSVQIIKEYIDEWSEGLFKPIKIDESKATYYHKRTPADGKFDFNMSAKKLYDFIRAQTEPYPGAFFIHNNENITVLKASRTDITSYEPSGTILGTTADGGIYVVCGDNSVIELLRLKCANGIYKWFAEDYRFKNIKRL